MHWSEQYIGVPFLDHGRTVKGWDCWGLVYVVSRLHFYRELPSLQDGYTNAFDAAAVGALVDQSIPLVNATRLQQPVEGCVVLMSYRGATCHVGLYLSDGQVLHVLPRIDTVVDRLDSIRLCRRVEGFYSV